MSPCSMPQPLGALPFLVFCACVLVTQPSAAQFALPTADEVVRRGAAFRDDSAEKARLKVLEESIQSQYGVRPLRYFGYLDEKGEQALAEAILEGSRRANGNPHGVSVDPAFVFTVAMAEGLNLWMNVNYDGNYPNWMESAVDGYQYVGLDWFKREQKELKSGDFLRSTFQGFREDRWVSNEKGERLKVGVFYNLSDAMEALAATIAYRKWLFLEDARKFLGEQTVGELTEAEINFWTYIYFNPGPGFGMEQLQSKGRHFFRRWTGPPRLERKDPRNNAHYKAMLRLATWELVSQSGLFAPPAPEPAADASGPGILDWLDAAEQQMDSAWGD